jgi:protein involved in polysaccharide export with SLBB domain
MTKKSIALLLLALYMVTHLVSQAVPGGAASSTSGAGASSAGTGSSPASAASDSSSPAAQVGTPADSGVEGEKQLVTTQRPMPAGLTTIESMFWAALPVDAGVIKQYGYSFFSVPAPVITAAVGDDYIVGPGDVIVAYLWGDPVDIAEIKNVYELSVDRDGTLFFPPIGRITVWGQSISTVREVFRSNLARKYKKLETSLTLGKLREFPVYVSGFVGKPGTVVATAVDSLFDVVARAGGVLSTGSLRSFAVTRKDGSSLSVDMYDVLVRGKNVDIRMREGDSVLVRQIGPVVGIAGQVRRPAVYELRGEKRVSELLELAGGALPSAFTAGSYLVRFQDQQRRMTGGDISTADFLASPLFDGDLLYVSRVKDFVENSVSIEGQVKFPGAYPLERDRSLKSILAKVQVLTDTNLRYARLYRIAMGGLVENRTFAPRDVLTGKLDFQLEPFDRLVFYRYGDVGSAAELRDFRSTIVVQGSVRYPGMYFRDDKTKLSSILTQEQILPETNVNYARIVRLGMDGKRPNLTFSPAAVLRGAEDYSLEPLDTIRFFRNTEAIDEPSFSEFRDTIVIKGAVRFPNLYWYKTGTSLRNLLTADQLTSSTSLYYGRIERIEAGGVQKTIPFIPTQILSGEYDIPLEPMDVVSLMTLAETTRTMKSPTTGTDAKAAPAESPAVLLERIQNAMQKGEILVVGEVLYSGIYGHRGGLKLSSILKPDQILPGTNLQYARIERRGIDGKRPNLTFSPAAVIAGIDDLPLESLDTIRFFRNGESVDEPSFSEFRETVVIKGAVRYPNLYRYTSGLRLGTLLTADQLMSTTSLYYGRIQRTEAGGVQKTIPFIPKEILSGEYDIPLEPMDVVNLMTLAETTRTLKFQRAGSVEATTIPAPASTTPATTPVATPVATASTATGAEAAAIAPVATSAAESPATLVERYQGEMKYGEILVLGEVFYSGIYGHRAGLKLSSILKADQLLPDTNLQYARIERKGADGKRPNLTFSPAAVIAGEEDYVLESLDTVRIFRNAELVNEPSFTEFRDTVVIKGAVRFPNLYRFKSGMRLGNLLTQDQLTATTSLYYGKIQRTEAGGVQKTIPFIPKEILSGEYDIALEPMDVVNLMTLAETTRTLKFQRAGSVEAATVAPPTVAPAATSAAESPATLVERYQGEMKYGEILVLGEILYSGIYGHRAGLKLSSILKADQVLPDTNLQYARIERKGADGKRPNLTFSPAAVIAGEEDYVLESLDTVRIFRNAESVNEPSFTEFKDTVVIKGAVRFPNLYRYKSGMRLGNLLTQDQLTATTSLYYGKIQRTEAGGVQKTIPFIPKEILSGEYDIALEPMDIVNLMTLAETTRTLKFQRAGSVEAATVAPATVAPAATSAAESPATLVERYQGEMKYGEILVLGEILYSGIYGHRAGLKLSSILKADQVLPDTNLQYARIERKGADGKRPNLTFSPAAVIAGEEDYVLESLDTVSIFRNADSVNEPSFSEFRDTLVIKGAVRFPNLYHYKSGMRLGNLLTQDQLTDASSLYYGRIQRTQAGGIQKMIPFIPKEILSGDYDILLEPMDIVTLFTLSETRRTVKFIKAGSTTAAFTSAVMGEQAPTPEAAQGEGAQAGAQAGAEAGGQAGAQAGVAVGVGLSAPSVATAAPSVATAAPAAAAMEGFQGDMEYGEVLVLGELRYSGIYGHRTGLKLSTILTQDQLLPETNLFYGEIRGYTAEGLKRRQTFIPKSVLNGNSDVVLEPLDTVVLYKIGLEPDTQVFDDFPHTIVIEGPVHYPGVYAYESGMMLSDLIRPEQFQIETSMQYAEIYKRPDMGRGKENIVTFSPEEVLRGDNDLALDPMDTIRFFSRLLYKPVSVSGEVMRPVVVPYYQGLDLLELLRTVDLRGEAAALKARIFSASGQNSLHYLDELLGRATYPTIALSEGDRIVIQKIEENEHRPFITIKGEVASPKTALWESGMRLSDLIREAGGYTKDAYPKALVIVRKTAAELQKIRLDDLTKQLDLAIMEAEKRAALESTTSSQMALASLGSELSTQKAQLQALKESRVASALGRISVNLPNTLDALIGSSEDIVLERDDTVFVPQKPSYVLVVGAVNNQVVLAYKEGTRVRDALTQAGWTTARAKIADSYVIRANGQVQGSKRKGFLWFEPSILNEILGPGDTLVVPAQTEAAYLVMPIVKDIVQIVTQVAGTTVSTLALLKQ